MSMLLHEKRALVGRSEGSVQCPSFTFTSRNACFESMSTVIRLGFSTDPSGARVVSQRTCRKFWLFLWDIEMKSAKDQGKTIQDPKKQCDFAEQKKLLQEGKKTIWKSIRTPHAQTIYLYRTHQRAFNYTIRCPCQLFQWLPSTSCPKSKKTLGGLEDGV